MGVITTKSKGHNDKQIALPAPKKRGEFAECWGATIIFYVENVEPATEL